VPRRRPCLAHAAPSQCPAGRTLHGALGAAPDELEDAGTRVARTHEGGVDILDADLDDLRDYVAARSDLRTAHVCDHDRAVAADLHLRAVVNAQDLRREDSAREARRQEAIKRALVAS
jgi:hypothetical protein